MGLRLILSTAVLTSNSCLLLQRFLFWSVCKSDLNTVFLAAGLGDGGVVEFFDDRVADIPILEPV